MRQIASALVLACALVAGCVRMGSIYNVNDAAVATANGKAVTAQQVRSAIMTAASALGWRVVDKGPGKLEATLVLRTHTAVVDIPYSSRSYSIIYKSSVNLNEENGQIHRNYNGWVQNLDNGIRSQLNLM